MRSYYIDSSAILSIVFDDVNAKAMKTFLGSTFYSSQITRVEVIRAVYRIAPEREEIARKLLDSITIVPVRTTIVTQAERLPEKINIRGMDALHLATANTLDFLRSHGVITYDKQMAKAAQTLGFEVFVPTVK
jgi:predicted nucleic acid-binding protein